MTKVLGLGDNVCDVYLHTGVMYPGGQAVNFAVYASRLGVDSDFMGVFGTDIMAEHVQNALDKYGVGRSHCRSYQGENGFARVTLIAGDRVFKGSNQGGVIQEHPIYLDKADLEYVSSFDLVHTTNNGFTDDLLPQMYRLPPLISYDFSYQWNEENRLNRVCPYVDAVFLSCSNLDDDETMALCRRIYERGCRLVTATRGSKGATVFDGNRFYRQLPDMVVPVDTMGAGDSFATAMLVDLLNSADTDQSKKLLSDRDFLAAAIPHALKTAAAFSASTCLVCGAFDCGVPVPDSVHDRIFEGV